MPIRSIPQGMGINCQVSPYSFIQAQRAEKCSRSHVCTLCSYAPTHSRWVVHPPHHLPPTTLPPREHVTNSTDGAAAPVGCIYMWCSTLCSPQAVTHQNHRQLIGFCVAGDRGRISFNHVCHAATFFQVVTAFWGWPTRASHPTPPGELPHGVI